MTRRQEIHDQIFYYGLILVALTLPFSLLANSISIILLTINWLVEGNFKEKLWPLRKDFLFLSFICFYLLHVLGMLYSDNFTNGSFELQKKLSLLVFPLIIATSRPMKTAQITSILGSLFLTTLATTVICLGYAIYRTDIITTFPTINWLYFSYRDLTMIINIQHTYLALYVCFSIFFLLHSFAENIRNFSTMKKAGILFLVLYLIFFLFLLASRAAIAAFIVISFLGILYYFIRAGRALMGWTVLAGLALFIGILIYQMPFMKERFLLTLGVEQETVWINQYGDGVSKPNEDRKLTWNAATRIIKENYLAGIGTGDVQDALQLEYKKAGFDVGYESRLNAHNQYLETWIGIGIVGFLSLITCLLAPAIRSYQENNTLYLAFLGLMVISFITECMLCRQQGVVFYAMFNSLFAFHLQKKSNSDSSKLINQNNYI